MALLGRLGQEYIDVWDPQVSFIKVFIYVRVHGESARLGPFPKDPTGTEERPLVNSRSFILERFQNGHMERERPRLGVLVKLLERPFLYGLLENSVALGPEESQLRRFTRTDVPIDDYFHR